MENWGTQHMCELSAITVRLLLCLFCLLLFIHLQSLYVGNKSSICCKLLQTYFGEMRVEFDVGMMMSICERNTMKILGMTFH